MAQDLCGAWLGVHSFNLILYDKNMMLTSQNNAGRIGPCVAVGLVVYLYYTGHMPRGGTGIGIGFHANSASWYCPKQEHDVDRCTL